MIKKITLCVLLACFLGINTTLVAQKIVNARGEAQVRVERNKTEAETRELAEQQAMINAIENAFGLYTEQQFDMTIKNGLTTYNTIGTTKVKGDWIETTDIDFSENLHTETIQGERIQVKYITCNVEGRVRQTLPRAGLAYQVLNSPNLLSRTTSFRHEEQLYVYFKSPVSGYLSIFLEDEEAVYRLLPYMNMSDQYQSGVAIKGDTDYLFFSPSDNAFPGNAVDEPRLLSLKQEVEYNYIYLVFSEDEFVKPLLDGSTIVEGRIIPKQLSSKKFQQWLVNNRITSDRFQAIKVKISIEQGN